jgi:antitoxin VapB
MKIGTVFKNGPSTQAVRIPKEYRLPTKEVWVEKIGDSLIIKPKPASWDDFFSSSLTLSEDFSMERNQQPPQNRDKLFS